PCRTRSRIGQGPLRLSKRVPNRSEETARFGFQSLVRHCVWRLGCGGGLRDRPRPGMAEASVQGCIHSVSRKPPPHPRPAQRPTRTHTSLTLLFTETKKYPPEGGYRFYSTARALLHAKVIHDALGRLT